MQKISGIIPSSPRVASTDLSVAKAVRPGAPTFGAPVGSSSLGPVSQLPVSALDRIKQLQEREMSDAQRKEAAHADIATRMADSFFLKNRRTAETSQIKGPEFELAELKGTLPSPVEEGLTFNGLGEDSTSQPMNLVDEDTLLKGGHVDVMA